MYEWSAARARERGKATGEWERRDYPRWPAAETVAGYHSTWRAALLAAGLPGGRPPLELPLNERVEAAQRMHAAGIRIGMIADDLGVGAETARKYLRASRCDCARNWMINGPRCTECAREDAVRIAAARRRWWDSEEVIAALKRWAAIEGQAPSSETWLGGRHARGRWAREYPQWPSTAIVSSRFGSWNSALVAVGLPAKPSAYSDEQLIDAVRADARRLRRTPTIDGWRARGPAVPGIGAVISHFGSWNAGVRAAGLRVTREHGIWTRERVLGALRRDAARRGRTPVREDWSEAIRTRPQASTVETLFGTWNAGLRAAGLEPNVERDKWTEATVLEALRELERELGRQPTSSDVARPPRGYPNNAVIRRKLGSWGAACRALGWRAEPRVISNDQQMLDALNAAAAELGAAFPLEQYKAISAARGWPSANAITTRFRSWNTARQTAGLPVLSPQRRDWSAEQLARALRSAARRLGRTPMAKDWNRLAPGLGWPHSATVMRRLGGGSWKQAIDAAGLKRRSRFAWSANEVIALLRADAYRRGCAPRAHEWLTRDPGRPTSHQVTNLLGSWNAALLEAGLETYRPAA